jgi:hypothetical protein
MRFDRLIATMLIACMAVGCETAKIAEPLTATTSGNDENAQLEFYHTLAGRSMASNDEAFHAMLLFLHGEDPAEDYSGRVAAMNTNNLIPAGFDRPAEEAATKGTMAVIAVSVLKIKGGLTMRLFGPVPRYALRELHQMGLFPPGSSVNQTISGSEMLTVIGKIEDYQIQQGTQAIWPLPEITPAAGDMVDDATPEAPETPEKMPETAPE